MSNVAKHVGIAPGPSSPRCDPQTWSLGLAECLFLALCICSTVPRYLVRGDIQFADDAYYYFDIARHIVINHVSSFDGFTLTNGYHPLWLGIISLQYWTLGQTPLLTRAIEIGLGASGLWSFLLYVRASSVLCNVIYAVSFYLILSTIALNGMETDAFACFFCAFVYCGTRLSDKLVLFGVCDGVLALCTIGARVDAAVFVLPILLLASESSVRRAVSGAIVIAGGVVYFVANRLYFGVGLPISGEIKSLGGFQINVKLLGDLAHPTRTAIFLLYLSIMLALYCLLVLRYKESRGTRSLLIAYLVGLAVFLIRLFLFSSWTIWTWYGYPVLIGFVAVAPYCCLVVDKHLSRMVKPASAFLLSSLMIVVVAGAGVWKVARGQFREAYGFYKINTQAVEQFGVVLGKSRVAMGDRAGEFAYIYPGPVNQLEGLVNDRSYLDALRGHDDIKSLLCDRDIRFLLSYEPDLGLYTSHNVQTIRTGLSQFRAPNITVSKRQEIGRVSDLSLYQDHEAEKRSYLYIWKLDCGR